MKIVRFALIAYEVPITPEEVDIVKETNKIVSLKNLVSREFVKGYDEEPTQSLQEVIHKYITTDILDEMKGEIECSM